MKLKLLFTIFLISAIQIFSQDYPEVTIKDINFVPGDSLLSYGASNSEPQPSYVGDTVIVTGVLMNSPYFGTSPDSGAMLAAGAPSSFLQDTAMTEWSGILIRYPSTPVPDAYANLDSGYIVKVKGTVVEYFTTTEFDVISFEAPDVIGQMPRPKPVVLTLDSLYETGTANPNYLAEKWEGVYVEIRNVKTSDPGVVGGGTFRIYDDNGTSMIVYNKGYYYRNSYTAPLPGTSIDYVRGYIETRTSGSTDYGWFLLDPVYPNDIKVGEISPPNISDVTRDKVNVGYGDAVTISAIIVDADGTAAVDSVTLNYIINGGDLVTVPMTSTDSIYSATIPAQNDSSIVKYYIRATDLDNAEVTNPSNVEEDSYFYFVLNRDISIYDVQYSPFGSGYSAFNGYEVSVEGVVTTDTTDIQGDGANISAQVYIQDGAGPWRAIQVFGTEAEKLRRGDMVKATGIVNESFGITRIGTLDENAIIEVLSSGNPLPEPVVLSTVDIDSKSDGSLIPESYEGVLVKFENLTVTDANADGLVDGPDEGSGGSRNFGEVLITDTSNVTMRMETQDGTHSYHNFWDASLENAPNRISTGDTFESITGILFYSFSNYKLDPRKDDDFVGHVTTGINDIEALPTKYELSQNYPNPFNPSTTIKYYLPKDSNVKFKVYDILGREVANLVNDRINAGEHTVNFDASNLASGIYIYRINAGSFVQAKMMMLIK